MKTRVYSLLMEFHKENDVEFLSDRWRFRWCDKVRCDECNVHVKCPATYGGAVPTISKAQMNKFKIKFPEDFI